MIQLSKKQEEAILNMFEFLGKGSEVSIGEFETYAEFQAFFEELKKQCQKKSIIMDKVAKNKELGIAPKEKEWNEKNLTFYLNKLIERYGNYSRRTLYGKLLQRTKDLTLIETLLDSFEASGKINEDLMKENKVNSKLKQGYGSSYIRSKLFQAGIKDLELNIDKDEELESLNLFADKIVGKYNLKDYKEKQNFISKLCRRGFSFNLINKYLKNKENN